MAKHALRHGYTLPVCDVDAGNAAMISPADVSPLSQKRGFDLDQ
jgi:hypothetical protein